jgi:hypothetical protein
MGTPEEYSFDRAQQAPAQLNEQGGWGGFKDWSVPTIRQLATLRLCANGFRDIVDINDGESPVPMICVTDISASLAIDVKIFPIPNDVPTWSSSYARKPGFGWRVSFADSGYVWAGGINGFNLDHNVRLVRITRLSINEAALAFPIRLIGMSKVDIARTKDVEAEKEARKRRDHAAREAQNRSNTSVTGRGGLRELVFLEATKSYAARCNNGNSDVFERTTLGQYCGGSSADGYKCFSAPSLTAQHICK